MNSIKQSFTSLLSLVLFAGLFSALPIAPANATDCTSFGYSATIQYQGGTIVDLGRKKSKTISDCGGYFAITIPTRANYVFAGWLDDTNANAGGIAYDNLDSTTTSWAPNANQLDPDLGYGTSFTLFAQWTPLSYAVTYSFMGATGGDSAALPAQASGNQFLVGSVINGSVLNLPTPTKAGYTFAGWSYNGTTYAVGQQFTMPSNAVTFTATWTAITYNITFDGNGFGTGSIPSPLTYTAGNAATAIETTYNPGDLQRANYTFAGWGATPDTTTAVTSYSSFSNATLYAIWSGSRYTIAFTLGSGATGTVPASQTNKTVGSIITLPGAGNIAKTGYNVVGWSDGTETFPLGTSYTVPSGGKTLSAVFVGRTYLIQYNANGAETGTPPANQNYTVGTTFTRVGNTGSMVKPGYLFIGWQDSNGTVVSSSYVPTASTTFSARWEANQYKILYDAYDGRGWANAAWYSSGNAPVTLRVPTRAGYTFAGWYVGNSRIGDASNSYLTYAPNMACNNYNPCYTIWAGARWNPITYTISFNSSDAAGSVPANQSFTSGGARTTLSGNIGAPALAKPFYSFGGWSATPGGTSKVTSYASAADQTFYAIWNPISYKVTYNSNGSGSTVTPTSATSVAGANVTLPTPSRSGYTFSGWYTNATSGTLVGLGGVSYQPNSAITLFARWTKN